MICLNSVMDLMRLSSTIRWQVCASTPVDISCEVVAMTGKVDSGSMKLSSCALPSSLSPVMRMTYLLLAAARSGLALTSAWRMRSAWSMFSQKTMVLAKRSVALRNSVILAATSSVRFSRIRFRSKSVSLYSRSSMSWPYLSVLPFSGRQPSRSLSMPMRTTLYGARKPSAMPCLSE